METYANPFLFLLVGFSLGFWSSFFFGVFIRCWFPTQEIEKGLG